MYCTKWWDGTEKSYMQYLTNAENPSHNIPRILGMQCLSETGDLILTNPAEYLANNLEEWFCLKVICGPFITFIFLFPFLIFLFSIVILKIFKENQFQQRKWGKTECKIRINKSHLTIFSDNQIEYHIKTGIISWNRSINSYNCHNHVLTECKRFCLRWYHTVWTQNGLSPWTSMYTVLVLVIG